MNFILATEFSKKTGDFKSLSAVDLRVIALTYQLEREFCDVTHVKSEPSKRVSCHFLYIFHFKTQPYSFLGLQHKTS